MSWALYTMDTRTGLLRQRVDVPSFSWSVTVSDASLSTTRDKGTGEGEASSLTVPWSAVTAIDASARASELSIYRRGVALFWDTGEDPESPGRPIVAGAIGPRTDTWLDTSFSLVSYMFLLGHRYVLRPERFGASPLRPRAAVVGGGLRAGAGKDGRAVFVHVKYSDEEKPTAIAQTSEYPRAYVGTYADRTPTDSMDPARYAWGRLADKQPGKGIECRESGTSGKTWYLHVAYAASGTGAGISTDSSSGRTWVGTYADDKADDSVDPRRYSWRRGADDPEAARGATADVVAWHGMSRRGIASEAGSLVTDQRPGGQLPVDWSYRGERGSRSVTCRGFDAANLAWADLVKRMADEDGGPDVQLRPYVTADNRRVRHRLVMGSDATPTIGSAQPKALACFPGGGTLENVSVAHIGPTSRVLATGSGTDARQLCHCAEDLTLQRLTDPWPLVEEHYGDSDADTLARLSAAARGRLAAVSRPLMQLSGTVDAFDSTLPLGTYWPGDPFAISIDGFPTIPDGTYLMRLMEMSGDEGTTVKLKFDVTTDGTW